jgi:transcriptional regulator with XRE-family HTH domain
MPVVDISTPKRKYKTLGALAKGIRLKRRLTQQEVADRCELTLANVRSIETNKMQANYCYDYVFALSNMRSRPIKRTTGGKYRAGRKRKR